MNAYVAFCEGRDTRNIQPSHWDDSDCDVLENFFATAACHPLKRLNDERGSGLVVFPLSVEVPSTVTPHGIFDRGLFGREANKLIMVRQHYDGREVGIGRALDPNWIDIDGIRQWVTGCEENHQDTCGRDHENLAPITLPWVIDTTRCCLVPGSPGMRYVALSYVWGSSKVFKTIRSLLEFLRTDGSLGAEGPFRLPQTVRHAIDLCNALGERYLWIDALCIVQDDDEVRNHMIANMTAVYANTTFTIIAADGDDADHGLRGLQGISQPRKLQSEPFAGPFGSQWFYQPTKRITDTKWNARAWTFQEYVFSPRHLIFIGDSVRWECREACCWEEIFGSGKPPPFLASQDIFYDVDCSAMRRTALFPPPRYPDLRNLETLVSSYNLRNLTHDEDAIPAFMGVLTVLRPIYSGGFINGLPRMFLNSVLFWTTRGDLPRRRTLSSPPLPPSEVPPSWTWAGWQGEITFRGVDKATFTAAPRDWTVPLVEWFTRTDKDSENCPILGQNEWYLYRQRYMGLSEGLPPGWTHHDIEVPSGSESAGVESKIFRMYQHPCGGSIHFCHPIPISDASDRQTPDTHPRFLSCYAQQAILRSSFSAWSTAPGKYNVHRSMNLLDSEGETVAVMYPDEAFNGSVGVVAISGTYKAEFPVHADREKIEFYNVICVQWQDGIAYRKGSGKIKRDIWEALEKEWVDLVLG